MPIRKIIWFNTHTRTADDKLASPGRAASISFIIAAIGKGATECTTDKYQAANAPECHRVDVTLIPGAKCTQ